MTNSIASLIAYRLQIIGAGALRGPRLSHSRPVPREVRHACMWAGVASGGQGAIRSFPCFSIASMPVAGERVNTQSVAPPLRTRVMRSPSLV